MANPTSPAAAAAAHTGLKNTSSDDNKGKPISPAQVGVTYHDIDAYIVQKKIDDPPPLAVTATSQKNTSSVKGNGGAFAALAQMTGAYDQMDADVEESARDAASGSIAAPPPPTETAAFHDEVGDDEKKTKKRAEPRRETVAPILEDCITRKISSMSCEDNRGDSAKPPTREDSSTVAMSVDARARLQRFEGRVDETFLRYEGRVTEGDRSLRPAISTLEDRIARKMSSMDDSGESTKRPTGGDSDPSAMANDARARLQRFEGRVAEAASGSGRDQSRGPANSTLEDRIARKMSSMDDSGESTKWPLGGDSAPTTMADAIRARMQRFEGRVAEAASGSGRDQSRGLINSTLEDRIARKMSSMDDSGESTKWPLGGDPAPAAMSDDSRARLQRFEGRVGEAARGSVGDHPRGLTNSVLDERMARKMASMDDSGESKNRPPCRDSAPTAMADDSRAQLQRFEGRVAGATGGSAGDHWQGLTNSVLEKRMARKMASMDGSGELIKRPLGGDLATATMRDDAQAQLKSYDGRVAEATRGSSGDHSPGLTNIVLAKRIARKIASMDGSGEPVKRPLGGDLATVTMRDDAQAQLKRFDGRVAEAARGSVGDHSQGLTNNVLEERMSRKIATMDGSGESAKQPPGGDTATATMTDNSRAQSKRYDGRATGGSSGDHSPGLTNIFLAKRIARKIASMDGGGDSSNPPPDRYSAPTAMAEDARARLQRFDDRAAEARASAEARRHGPGNNATEDRIARKKGSTGDGGESTKRPPGEDAPSSPLFRERDATGHQARYLSAVAEASSSPPLDKPPPQSMLPSPSEVTNAACAIMPVIPKDPSIPMLEATAVEEEVYDAVPVEEKTCLKKNQKFIFGSLGLLLGLGVAVAVGVSLSSNKNTSVEESVVRFIQTTTQPSESFSPSEVPSPGPAVQPSESPSPSHAPSFHPTLRPSFQPSKSSSPSGIPTLRPSIRPSKSFFPSESSNPSLQPTLSSPPSTFWSTFNWNQQGRAIGGDASHAQFGWDVALSADGRIMAIGASGAHKKDDMPGYVKVYHREGEGSSWEQRGDTLYGDADGDRFGYSLSISVDGRILVVGAPWNDSTSSNFGQVKVYAWEEASSNYKEHGDDLYGGAAKDFFGWSLDLSADGETLAIGANQQNAGSKPGYVVVYSWDEAASKFEQQGQAINGDAADDCFGFSLALSGDSKKLVVAAPRNNLSVSHPGQVKIFAWDEASLDYEPLGYVIGGAGGDSVGNSGLTPWFRLFVSLSEDGTTLAIGAPDEDNGKGAVKIFAWDAAASNFTHLGQGIRGKVAKDHFGASVALSSDGNAVAVGAPQYGTGKAGYAEVHGREEVTSLYKQIGRRIDGNAGDDEFGRNVAFSGVGVLAVGASKNDDNGKNSGEAEVFSTDLGVDLIFV